jgi:hypothetical protein
MASRPTSTALDPRWLVSQRFDLTFVLLGGILLSALCLALVAMGTGFLALAIGYAIALDFPHVMQTYVRIWLEPHEAKLYGRDFLTSLAIIAVCATYLYLAGELVFLIAVWIYWQPFHVLKQHMGIARIYNAKRGYRNPSPLADQALWLGCAAPILYRISTTGLHFENYVAFGRRLPFSNLTVPAPPMPSSVVALAYLLFAGATLLLIREQWTRRRRGEITMSTGAAANLILAVASYNIAYGLVSNLYASLLIASSVHSLQYHAICWSYNHRRMAALADPDSSAPLLAFISRRESVPVYIGFILALGGVCAGLQLVANGLLPLIIVLHHFYFDGIIWRSAVNADLKVGLGLGEPRGA